MRHRRSSDKEPANGNSPLPHEPQQRVVSPDERKVSRTKGTTGSRNALMVPKKPEKRTPRDPVEGSEASGQGTAEGKHEQDFEPDIRVNETSADSETGETDAAGGT